MKFGVPFLLLVFAAFIIIANADERRCAAVLPKGLKIQKNSYVSPGPRASSKDWYESVEWKRIPYGKVEVNYEVRVDNYGLRWNILTNKRIDLFLLNDKSEEGSMAKLMRFALGIPRNPRDHDMKKGIVKTDPDLFKNKPCTVIYTNYKWYTNSEYEIYITVTILEANQIILKGYLRILS